MLGLRDQERETPKGGHAVAFSDGAIETTDASNTMFGPERMAALIGEVLASGAPLERVREHLADYRGAGEQEDDLTMVVVPV